MSTRQRTPYEAAPLKTDDTEDALHLLRMALGSSSVSPRTPALWNWKHVDNPFGASMGFCARSPEGELVGLRPFMQWAWDAPTGNTLRAVRAVDTATHPDHRRRGVFTMLTEKSLEAATEEGVRFVFNTPNENSLPGYLKLGWEKAGTVPVYIRPLRPLRMANILFSDQSSSARYEQSLSTISSDLIPWSEFAASYDTEAAALVEAWEQERPQAGYRTPRDWNYLSWRYGDHPHLTYGVLPIRDEQDLVGFAVFRPNLRFGLVELVCVDLVLASESYLQTAESVFSTFFRSANADYAAAHFADGTVERDLLRASWFFSVPGQGITLVANSLDTSLPRSPTQLEHWDLTLGDLEPF